MLSKSDATLFDGDTVAELVTELVDMKRRSGAPDAETDLKIVLDFNSDGPSDINNQTLTKHRIQKLRQTLSPHLALAFLSKIGAKRARVGAAVRQGRALVEATPVRLFALNLFLS